MNTDSKIKRIGVLYEALKAAADARAMVHTEIWSRSWDKLEQELLERLLECGPTDDAARYRLQTSIEVERKLRSIIESAAAPNQLQYELDVLEGRKPSRIA